MELTPCRLAGSQVYVIIDEQREIFSFENEIFAFGRVQAEILASAIDEHAGTATSLSWYLRGSEHDAMLCLRSCDGKTIGLIRLVEQDDGKVELFHYDEGVALPDGNVLIKHGVTYECDDLIGKLRELALGLTAAPIT